MALLIPDEGTNKTALKFVAFVLVVVRLLNFYIRIGFNGVWFKCPINLIFDEYSSGGGVVLSSVCCYNILILLIVAFVICINPKRIVKTNQQTLN